MKGIFKALLFFVFILAACSNFMPNFPDAIRCGVTGVDGEAGILFLHAASLGSATYCEVYSPEARCVTFVDRKQSSSSGHQGTVGWCAGKTIDDLVKAKRAWGFAQLWE